MSDDVEDTPVTQPGKKVPRRNNTPVPNDREFENTGEVAAPLYEAATNTGSAEQFLSSLAQKLSEHGGGSGGVPPEKHAKSIKRHNWITILMAAMLGPGGALAIIYATSDRSKSNEAQIEKIDQEVNGSATKVGLDARVEQAEEDVRAIRSDVEKVSESMDTVQEQSEQIADGIKELKQENVDRLEKELDAANRELRRRRRLDGD